MNPTDSWIRLFVHQDRSTIFVDLRAVGGLMEGPPGASWIRRLRVELSGGRTLAIDTSTIDLVKEFLDEAPSEERLDILVEGGPIEEPWRAVIVILEIILRQRGAWSPDRLRLLHAGGIPSPASPAPPAAGSIAEKISPSEVGGQVPFAVPRDNPRSLDDVDARPIMPAEAQAVRAPLVEEPTGKHFREVIQSATRVAAAEAALLPPAKRRVDARLERIPGFLRSLGVGVTEPLAVPRDSTLAAGERYRMLVTIGARSDGSLIAASVPAIEDLLPPPPQGQPGWVLDVVLYGLDFTVHDAAVQQLNLPRTGPSGEIAFTLVAPKRTGPARARLCLYHGNHLLQSFLLRAEITDEETRREAEVLAMHLEVSRTRFDDVDAAAPRAASFAVNDDPRGDHTFLVKQGDTAIALDLPEAAIAGAMRRARELLGAAIVDPASHGERFPTEATAFTASSAASFAAVLNDLAYLGEELRLGLTGRSLPLKKLLKRLASSKSEVIQVVRLDPGFALPWPLVYDRPLPTHRTGRLVPRPSELIGPILTRVSLAHPRLHLTLRHNGKMVFELPPTSGSLDRLRLLFGDELADQLVWVESEHQGTRMSGYVGLPSFSKSTRKQQYLFLNGRWIQDRTLQHALTEAYRGLLMVGRQPIAFLFLEMSPDQVDVNVHPAKAEVRFREPGVARGHARRRRSVCLLPQQADDDRRRRHDRHRQRRVGQSVPLAAQPGPRCVRRLAEPHAPGLQLPARRAKRGAWVGADRPYR